MVILRCADYRNLACLCALDNDRISIQTGIPMSFVFKLFLGLSLLFLYWMGLSAAPIQYRLDERNGRQQVRFLSEAPMETIDGSAREFSGNVAIDYEKNDFGLEGSVVIPVDSLETGLALRDEHLRSDDWLDADRYPTITFQLTPAREQTVKKVGANRWFLKVIGIYSMKGKSKRLTIPIELERIRGKKNEKIMLKGRFPVKLADHGVFGPRAMRMIGAKVSPEVQVSVKLVGVSR